jgi:hypothetical protein
MRRRRPIREVLICRLIGKDFEKKAALKLRFIEIEFVRNNMNRLI